MKETMTFVVSFACGLVLLFAAGAAQAELAKTGTFEGVLGWSASSEVTELGEGTLYWHGGFNGAFVNNEGSGFLHQAAVACPAAGVSIGDRNLYQGHCILTDADGDRVVHSWSCEMQDGRCPGTQTWVTGTGKYEGISGEMTFEGWFVGGTTQGVSNWKGNWKLP